jgi:hypothetical protein
MLPGPDCSSDKLAATADSNIFDSKKLRGKSMYDGNIFSSKDYINKFENQSVVPT